MDVNRAHRVARFAGMMLSLAVVNSTIADDAAVTLANTPSTLVLTDAAGGQALQLPPASGTQIVVRTDEGSTAAQQGTSINSGEATLSVVANSQHKAPVSTIVVDPEVTPAGATRGVRGSYPSVQPWSVFSGGPQRPPVTSPPRRTANPKPKTTPAPRANNVASRKQPRAPKAALRVATKPTKPAAPMPMANDRGEQAAQRLNSALEVPLKPANELLVQAYELSLTASSETEYSQIVRWCAEAMRLGLDNESRQFALQLSAWALNRRGQLRADQQQQELAVADFRAALEFDPKCWRALHNRGVTLAQNGQFAEAFDDICKVIDLNPQFAKAYSNRATLYVQAGDFDKAIADYETALHIEASLLPALVGHGRVCHMRGKLDEALGSFDAAIAQDDKNAEVICSRGDLLVDLGRYADALQDYAMAIDLNPKFEHAYRNGAWLLATCPDDNIRDADGALKGAQAALSCGYGERHAALDTLAAALANAGRFDEAVGTMQQAIEVAPEEARPAYQARQELYESHQPFRTHPIGDDVQTAEFIEG